MAPLRQLLQDSLVPPLWCYGSRSMRRAAFSIYDRTRHLATKLADVPEQQERIVIGDLGESFLNPVAWVRSMDPPTAPSEVGNGQ